MGLSCLRVVRHPEVNEFKEVLPLAKKNLSKNWKQRRELRTSPNSSKTRSRNHSHTHSQKHARASVRAHGITAPRVSAYFVVFFRLIILLNVLSLPLFSRRVPQRCLNRNQMTKRKQREIV